MENKLKGYIKSPAFLLKEDKHSEVVSWGDVWHLYDCIHLGEYLPVDDGPWVR